MPQSGFTPIQLYRSSTSSNTPSASDLVDGELAIFLPMRSCFQKYRGSQRNSIFWR